MIDKIEAKIELIYSVLVVIILWLILSTIDAFEYLVEFLETHEDYELDELVLLLVIIGLVSTIYSIRRILEAKKINSQLENVNKKLKEEIEKEIIQRHKQEHLLIQQSKLAAMGEMIGNIAHQWRQPLNALGLVIQNINFSYEMNELDDKFMSSSTKKANILLQNMSKTIDDFRSFFRPNKEKTKFILEESINQTISLVESTFMHQYIEIEKSLDSKTTVYGFSNEYSQTLLNILNNAKDAFVENKIDDSNISIEVVSDNSYGILKIKDNAGGIPLDIVDKIFDPYFTTKEEGKGTGIGLYMSKIIIEQNMNGKLSVENIKGGSVFSIAIPLYKGIKV